MIDELITSGLYPELSKFSNTEQDPEWHAEGNVKIHTHLVLDEIEKSLELYNLSDSEKRILRYAAVFHDYGKPQTTTTKVKNDVLRVVAPFHEEIGASLLFYCKRPPELAVKEYLTVLALVQLHDVPKKLVKNNAKRNGYFKLALNSNLKLLYILEKADLKGRICSDFEYQDEILELFKLQAQEYGLWEDLDLNELRKSFSEIEDEEFVNRVFYKGIYNYANGINPNIEDEIPKSYNYNTTAHVTMLCGLSASGKSMLVQKMLKERTYTVISLDKIRIELYGKKEDQRHNDEIRRVAYERLRTALRNNEYIIYDATNLRKDFRSKIIDLCNNYDAFISMIVICDIAINDILKRNSKRETPVPNDVILKQYNKFELPFYSEVHALKFINSSK